MRREARVSTEKKGSGGEHEELAIERDKVNSQDFSIVFDNALVLLMCLP